MKKLILVCGPAGIGKSTFCQKYIQQNPTERVKIIAADEVRKALCGSYRNFPPNRNMAPVYQGMVDQAKKAFEEAKDITILLDSTMLFDERRLFFVNSLPHFDETDLYLLKLHNWDLCLERNKKRDPDKWVPEDVIKDMVKRYQDPTPEVAKRFDSVKTFYLDD